MCGKNKKNLLIINRNESDRKSLCSLLDDVYNVIEAGEIYVGKAFLEDGSKTVSAILLNPSDSLPATEAFLKFMRGRASFSAIPVLLLADDNVAEEIKLLGDGAVDCIEKPYRKEIILNRIANAILLGDSISLQGIERMLKQLPSLIYLKHSDARYVFCTHYWHHLKRP